MKVRFALTMEDLVINQSPIDQVIIDWISDVDQQEIMEISHRWITTQNFLTRRMIGLERVGQSSLVVEPLEDPSNIPWP